MRDARVTYDERDQSVPEVIHNDPVWTVEAYRLSLFPCDLAWHDTGKLLNDKRTVGIADQLYRAVGRISANVCEGYSRGTARARITFYEYALGSAREARDWYYKGRHVLDAAVVVHRLELTTTIIRLSLATITQERRAEQRKRRGPDKEV